MLLQEIPALPFSLDAQSANQWLDKLPVGNIRECCQRFLPVLRALNVYPMQLQLRFDILDRCHPVVLRLARDLAPHFMDAQFPMEEKVRKIASLAARFHLEAALGYRQLVEAAAFSEGFTEPERRLIYLRALEHLLRCQLRSAQVYETPSSSVRSSLRKLYRHADSTGMLDESIEYEGRLITPRELFARAMLFALAVPRGLAQADIQRLFDILAECDGLGQGAEEGGPRSLFGFDSEDPDLLVPIFPASPSAKELHGVSADKALPALRAAASPERDPLRRVLPRLGGRLPCHENAGGRRVAIYAGFKGIVPMLRLIEFRHSKSGRRGEAWPGLNEMELVPLESPSGKEPPRFTGRSLAETVAADEAPEKSRMAEVVPTELPGFYLLDSGQWMLRAGLLVGLNSDDEWIQVGVVRSGQVRDGRFWHSFELLGAKPQLVRVRNARTKDGLQTALWLEGSELDAGASLIIEPRKWRGGDMISVETTHGKHLVRVVKVAEAAAEFYRFAVAKAEP
jgi:hypothetical protein